MGGEILMSVADTGVGNGHHDIGVARGQIPGRDDADIQARQPFVLAGVLQAPETAVGEGTILGYAADAHLIVGFDVLEAPEGQQARDAAFERVAQNLRVSFGAGGLGILRVEDDARGCQGIGTQELEAQDAERLLALGVVGVVLEPGEEAGGVCRMAANLGVAG